MIQINYRDGKPIYEQVKDGYRKLIINGLLNTDDKLPSVREMASSLAINPNTIQRAYRELEAEGYVYTVAGKGCFVAGVPKVNLARVQELLNELDDLVDELTAMQFGLDDICEHIKKKGEKQ